MNRLATTCWQDGQRTISLTSILLGHWTRLPTSDTDGRVYGAVARVHHVDVATQRTVFDKATGRAAIAASAFSVCDKSAGLYPDWMAKFINLDTVPHQHAAAGGTSVRPPVCAGRSTESAHVE